jgi:tellurite resistance protein
MVSGLAGLGNGWRAATVLWGVPAAVGEGLMAIAVATWLALVLLYAAKWAWAREAALAEWRQPVLCCYVGLGPAATLLAALAA